MPDSSFFLMLVFTGQGNVYLVRERNRLPYDHGCILENNTDITQQKQTERALRASEDQLHALTDTLETQVRVRTEELEQRNREVVKQSDELRQLSHHLMQVQDDERRRISRELHDSAGQTLAALGMCMGSIVRQAPEKCARIC